MRTIQKGPEPPTLTRHRIQQKQKQHADYDNYADKETLRIALVAEQRGLCCYCQSRIRPSPEHMKIEHWQCQDAHPDRQLDFSNLHGACLGGEGRPYREQHCDTRKGNDVLCFSVCDPTRPIENKIHFKGDGRISSDDPAIEHDINGVLNLNLAWLVSNRKGVLTSFQERLARGQRLDPARELAKWDGSQSGELEPFAQVVVYYLRKRQARAIR
jgi:uncharacterized protein (TIGR02646 family)